jgi:hypothetical protein
MAQEVVPGDFIGMRCLYTGGDGAIFLSPSRDGAVVVAGCEEVGGGLDFSSNTDFGVVKEIGLGLLPPTGCTVLVFVVGF